MDPAATIELFLSGVSKRLRKRAAISALVYLAAALTGLALISPLWALWADLDRSTSWIFLVLAGALVAFGGVFAIIVPRRRWARDCDSARYVGQEVQSIRSDLLSSLELMDGAGHGAGSSDLRHALFANTAARTQPLHVDTLVPYSALHGALKTLLCAIAVYGVIGLMRPEALAMGWNHLFREARAVPFDGAVMADKPLVDDVDVIVEFPLYTGKPDLNLPGSSGDFEVMPGSAVSLSAKVPPQVTSVRILLSSTDALSSEEEIDLVPKDGSYFAQFEVRNETYYRFEIGDGDGRKVEARARHIKVRADKAPTVEFFAPADELDITTLKRIELAYNATDDFGITKIELVHKEVGGRENRKTVESSAENEMAKSLQSKFLWDLAALNLRPGIMVEYYLEVTDNDIISGPKVTKSRSYKLRVFSPRERHEELLHRQEEVAQHMLELLAARLTVDENSLVEHLAISQAASEIVIELGSLVASFKSDELSQKALATTFQELRDRMDVRTKREGKLLSEFSRASQTTLAAIGERLTDSDSAIVAELENDILRISDWLHRQEIENLLGISDEIKSSQERLNKLFEEYKRTGSAEILNEIERELRALEKRLQEMSAQSSSMPEDVLDRFVNQEALKQEQEVDCLSKVKELLAEGDAEAAQVQMKKCSEQMDQSANALENSLRSLRSDTFSEEEKEFQEAMDKLADLAQDQKDVADKTDEIYERYSDSVSEMMKEKGAEVQKKASATLDKLKKKLQEIPRKGLSSFAKEELGILRERLRDTEDMLKRNEFAEALSMARYASRSLRTIRDELEFSLDEDWSRETVVAEKHAREAMPLARKLVDELKDATPPPSKIMSSEDKRQLENLKRQQQSVRKRSQKLAKKAGEKGKAMPGKAGQAMQEGLAQAMKHMQQAEKQMRGKDPGGAKQEAREAARELGRAQKAAQGAARQKQKRGRASVRDQPIAIPGAEDYKAPEEFREEILEAMKKDKGPAGFSEQVKRYYKEIIQ